MAPRAKTNAALPDEIVGQLVVPPRTRFAIVAGRFNDFITDRLIGGAKDCLERHGADAANITVVRVPGAWEIPLACQALARANKVDAVIAVGAVIRGGTPHFDYVASEVAKGVAVASTGTQTPVTFGVLTCDTIEQAVERAGTKAGNKGVEAALAAIEMVSLMQALGAAKLI